MANEQQRLNAIEAARARRVVGAIEKTVRMEWFINEVVRKVHMTLKQRVRLATEYLKNRVVINISRPVTKTVTGGRVKVSNRSLPGEFPKADTTNLLKTIFGVIKDEGGGVYDGYVGTPVDYGVILELEMDRSFLVRSLNEEKETISKIVTGPIR